MRPYLAVLLCSIFISAHAADMPMAPVVDADQDAQNTQMESVGTPWQNMQPAPDNQEALPAQANSSDASSASDNKAPNSMTASVSTGGLDERVNRLSQQVANMTQLNLPQQVTDLRETLSQLQGEIEVAQRDLKMLSQQQARLYEDLSQRMSQLNSGKAADVAAEKEADKNVPVTEASAYQAAFKLLSSKQYDKANTAFLAYLKAYPNGRFAVNAHYWLGEIAMQKKAYDDAYAQFQLLIAQYPTSNKVAEAKLKVAVIHAETGKKALAKIEFQQVQKAYPGSTAAQLASIQLQQMKG